MAKNLLLFLLLSFAASEARAQIRTPEKSAGKNIFERISTAMTGFNADTSIPPDDRLTRKIILLRNLRGGFNINEVMEFKLAEERQKGEKPAAELERMERFFSTGNGKRWLDHAAIWVYRNHYNYRDIKRMIRFYRSPAGRKTADTLPVIIVQLLAAAENILKAIPEK